MRCLALVLATCLVLSAAPALAAAPTLAKAAASGASRTASKATAPTRPSAASPSSMPTTAPQATSSTSSTASASACLAELAQREVSFRRVPRRGIAIPVEVTGPLGGVTYRYHEALVIDCSLAVSLAEAGRYLRDLGVTTLTVASAHSRRNVRGTGRPSKHSFGLAVDVPALEGPSLGAVRVDRDYEQGLGDDVDCVGAPLTAGGELLKIAQCQLVRSGLFYLVLSPDYDDAHHDHFHLEVRPWAARDELRSPTPAIH
jgi:hypothetical protein